jgi:hypothetical protein
MRQQASTSFLKKRSKRLLSPAASHASPLSGHVPDRRTRAEAKVFWFFSSEKNKLPSVSDA